MCERTTSEINYNIEKVHRFEKNIGGVQENNNSIRNNFRDQL